MPEAIDMMNFYRNESAFNTPQVPEEERFGTPVYSADGEQKVKFILGVLHKEVRPEFTEEYAKLRTRAAADAGKRAGA